MENALAEQIREKLNQLDGFMTKTAETFDGFGKQLLGVESDLQKVKGMAATGMRGFGIGGGPTAPETFGELIAKSADVQNFMKSAMRGGVKVGVPGRLRQKNITTLANVAGPTRMLPIEALPQTGLSVLDLIPSIQITEGTLKFNRQLAPRPTADYQLLEGDLKKEGDFTYEIIELAASTISIWTQASRQSISSVPGLQLFLENDLMYAVRLKEEQEVLNGAGGAGKIQGINPQATIVTAVSGQGFLDVAARVVGHLAAQGTPATGLVVNPTDLLGAATLKTTTGEYLLGSPTQGPPNVLWGVPLVQSVAQPVGTVTGGDFSRGALLAYADQASVELSSEDRDNFVRNLVTILAEERLILAVKAPMKFAKCVVIP